MLYDIIREQAAMLRSLADEMEAVAAELEKQDLSSSGPPVVPVADYGADLGQFGGMAIESTPGKRPPTELDDLAGHGVVASRYVIKPDTNMNAVKVMAQRDLERGVRVFFNNEEYLGD